MWFHDTSLSVQYRWGVYKNIRAHIDQAEGGMDNFTAAYNFYGLNRGEHEGKQGLWYREWAPGAQAIALIGEFNNWEPRDDHWAMKNDFGTFSLFLPDMNGRPQVPHKCASLAFSGCGVCIVLPQACAATASSADQAHRRAVPCHSAACQHEATLPCIIAPSASMPVRAGTLHTQEAPD